MKQNNNIFLLPNPDELICRIDEYHFNHQAMRLRIYHPQTDQKFLIRFLGVRNFSGTTKWIGANFQLCSWQETADLYKTIQEKNDVDIPADAVQEFTEKYFHLYKVASLNPETEIKVFAGSGRLVEEK
jgi:hypothetical protein